MPGVMALEQRLGLPWVKPVALLALPALVIGVAMYPNIQLALMPSSLALAIVVACAAGFVVTGHPQLVVLLPAVAACLPSRQAGFAAYAIALTYFIAEHGGRRLVRPLDAADRLLIAVMVWATMSWMINLGTQTDFWSLPVFVLTFLTPWLLLFVARAAPWSAGDTRLVLGLWLGLVMVQLVPALVKPAVTGELSAYMVPFSLIELTGVGLLRTLAATESFDVTSGTTASAHYLGVLLTLALVLLVAIMAARRHWLPLLIVATGYVFLMTDSKHVIVAAFPAGLVFLWRVVRPLLRPGASRVLVMALLIFVAIAGPWAAVRAYRILSAGSWRPYAELASLNAKAQLVKRTAGLLGRKDLNTWIGYGAGSYATRAATIRASAVLYKEGNELPEFIPAHTGDAYRSVAYDLYTTEQADAVKFRSGVLTLPFSSAVGVVAEFGLLGTLLVLAFFAALSGAGYAAWRRIGDPPLRRAAGAMTGFAMPFLFVLGFFDSYLEQPGVTGPMIVVAILALSGAGAAPEPVQSGEARGVQLAR